MMTDRFRSLLVGVELKSIYSAIILAVTETIGQNTLAYEVLFVLVILDTITGVMKGVKYRNISSRRFRRTIHKLLLYFTLIIACHQLTRLNYIFQWLEDFVVIFLAVTEILSIIENAHQLGICMPKWVVDKLSDYLGRDPYESLKEELKDKGMQKEAIQPPEK